MGSGISFEVSSALEAMVLLASKYSHELIPLSSHISGMLALSSSICNKAKDYFCQKQNFLYVFLSLFSGILDYLEGFSVECLHKVTS